MTLTPKQIEELEQAAQAALPIEPDSGKLWIKHYNRLDNFHTLAGETE